MAIAAFDDLGRLVDATGVQIPGVLDDLYHRATKRTLGITWNGRKPELSVWAPTAQSVSLLITPPGWTAEQTVAMRRDDDGVWSVRGSSSWNGATYRYQVTVYQPTTGKIEVNDVTDPYSVALTTNSARSVIVDLDAASLTPSGWSSLRKPALAQPEDSTIYELHIRDFSIGDTTVPAAHRGGYLAFTDTDSNGMKHLKALGGCGSEHHPPAAGLRHRHHPRGEGGPDHAGLRSAGVDRGEPGGRAAAGLRVRAGRPPTATTGVTTRSTTRCRRGRTRRTPTGRRAPSSSGRWSRR